MLALPGSVVKRSACGPRLSPTRYSGVACGRKKKPGLREAGLCVSYGSVRPGYGALFGKINALLPWKALNQKPCHAVIVVLDGQSSGTPMSTRPWKVLSHQ